MKNLFAVIFFIFIFLQQLAAQRAHTPSHPLFKKFADTSAVTGGHPFYIVEANREKLKSVKIIRELGENLFIVGLPDILSLPSNTVYAVANNSWKLSPAIENILLDKNDQAKKFILSALNLGELLREIKERHNYLKIIRTDAFSHSILIECKPALIKENFLKMSQVIFVDAFIPARPETNIIGYDRSFHGINMIDFTLPGADGKNIVSGVKEQGMDETDLDLWKRVLPSSIASTTASSHSTMIASIIGGAGNSSYSGRGIAHGTKFFPSSYSNLFADDATVLNAAKVSVQNHSYGTVIQQFYGAEALSYDVLSWNNKNYIAVMSAGNQGQAFATEGQYANIPGFANLTGNFKMAKNVITVAAIDNKENISSQSSAGPVYDGRIAPQITALGPNGTSDAAALVTGTIAVMQQVYADSNNQNLPPASLIKAVLYNTADDLLRKGPDYKTGYGMMNSLVAVRSIIDKKYDGGILQPGQAWSKTLSVPANSALVKITLSWTDTAASVNNFRALVNDLDLKLIELSTGQVYYPWVLSSIANKDSLEALPSGKRDSLNTAEQISIELPDPGNYEIQVTGTTITGNAIPFHISWKIDTLNTFHFTSPVHAADLLRFSLEEISIRWKTFVADTAMTGNLFISYDEGNSWNSLGSGIRLIDQKFQWNSKDTSSVALLKMETSFGNFYSGKFLIAPLTQPRLDFNCTDSFRLSWNKNIYAGSYKVYALTDKPYLENILEVTDSFVVIKKAIYPSTIWAIEPVLNNNLPAPRSSALDINEQGVYCFYKTLNYELLDANKLKLLLELSVQDHADSIFFEKVSGTGQILIPYPGIKANSSLSYQHLVTGLNSGTSYFRARIRLKNGTSIYTDIISVSTSGQKKILFYPNPANRKMPLNYILEQGFTDGRLQFFDMSGRLLLDLESLTDTIDLSAIPAGILFYRLMDNGKVVESGKIMIH